MILFSFFLCFFCPLFTVVLLYSEAAPFVIRLLCMKVFVLFFAAFEMVDKAKQHVLVYSCHFTPALVYIINIREVKAVSHFFSESKCLLLT